MIRCNQHAIHFTQILGSEILARQGWYMKRPHFRQRRYMWIRIGKDGSAFQQQFHQLKARTLSRVINILLVRDAKNANSRSIDCLAEVVQCLCDTIYDEAWHRRVYLAS